MVPIFEKAHLVTAYPLPYASVSDLRCGALNGGSLQIALFSAVAETYSYDVIAKNAAFVALTPEAQRFLRAAFYR